MPSPRKARGTCLSCQTELPHPGWKYCSNACQHQHHYQEYIRRWQAGLETGNINRHSTAVSRHIRRYMREKCADRCQKCGWDKQNPVTGRVPLVINHVDGNPYNTREENLEALCPNCDALTPTWGNRRQLLHELDRQD